MFWFLYIIPNAYQYYQYFDYFYFFNFLSYIDLLLRETLQNLSW